VSKIHPSKKLVTIITRGIVYGREQRFIHHHPQRKLVIFITRGNPFVVVSKNHPSSTKEGSSSYNHNKVQGNESCCDREQESSIIHKGRKLVI
jgi:hypothetical protein